jgi:hypothetical protein
MGTQDVPVMQVDLVGGKYNGLTEHVPAQVDGIPPDITISGWTYQASAQDPDTGRWVYLCSVPGSMPFPVWDVCQECGAPAGAPCAEFTRAEGWAAVQYLHESRRTVPTSEASRIARAHERWLPATGDTEAGR